MRRSTVRRTALCVSLLSFSAIFAIIGNTTPVQATAVAGVTLPSIPAPWVAVAASIQFASSINWYIKMFKLFLQIITGGGKDAACDLCDEVVTVMLELDDTKDSMELEGSELCDNICPFKIARCVNLCNKLLDAIQSSTKFPCEAIGVCEALDEFGEEAECKFSWAGGCQPSALCARTQTLPFPKCDLKPGKKKWKRLSKQMSENVGALANAVKSLPKCGEPGAHEIFCVDEPTGVHLVAEYLGYVLIFVVATAKSIYAIETKGGDDDRQWLSFWMIFFLFTTVERFTDVILSKFPIYYEVKLLALVYLILFDGAAGLYLHVHAAVRFLQRNLFRSLTALFAPADDDTEVQDYVRRRLEEKSDDEARLVLSDYAVSIAKQKIGACKDGKGAALFKWDDAAQRLDEFERAEEKAYASAVEDVYAEAEQAFNAAKSEQKQELSEVVNALQALKKSTAARRIPALKRKPAPNDKPNTSPQKPTKESSLVFFKKTKDELTAKHAALKGKWERLHTLRLLIKASLEQANYEFVLGHLGSEHGGSGQGGRRAGLLRVFTEPRANSIPLLRIFLVPLEQMAFRLCDRRTVDGPKKPAPDAGLPALAALPGVKDSEHLHQVIAKTQTTDWKELEVRFLEVSLEELANVPPVDSNGLCQPFVKLGLAQLQGQEDLVEVRPAEGGAAVGEGPPELAFQYPVRVLRVDTKGSGAKPFREYSRVTSKVQSRLVEGGGAAAKPTPRKAFWNQKLEMPVQGGAIDQDGEYHNAAAPYHVLVGEVWDRDFASNNDLVGFFQVPLAVLMDGLAHKVTAQVELTEEARDSIRSGAKADKGKAYLHNAPVTVTMTLQYAP